MIIDSLKDIEKVFVFTDYESIIEFCKQYALQNNEFTEKLIERFLKFNGENFDERIANIDAEVASCFNFKLKDLHKLDSTPFLDWNRITQSVWGLTQKGKIMLEQGYIMESVHLAIEILLKVSELYIEDTVWNDRDLDGDELCTDDALNLLSMAIKSNRLNVNEIKKISKTLKKIQNMSANSDYYLISSERFQSIF